MNRSEINTRSEAQNPAWKKELMRLIKKPNLTDTEIVRMIELNKRNIAEKFK